MTTIEFSRTLAKHLRERQREHSEISRHINMRQHVRKKYEIKSEVAGDLARIIEVILRDCEPASQPGIPVIEIKTGPIEDWVCQCGETPSASSPDWRWNGSAWEHHHGYPMGHVIATKASPRAVQECKGFYAVNLGIDRKDFPPIAFFQYRDQAEHWVKSLYSHIPSPPRITKVNVTFQEEPS